MGFLGLERTLGCFVWADWVLLIGSLTGISRLLHSVIFVLGVKRHIIICFFIAPSFVLGHLLQPIATVSIRPDWGWIDLLLCLLDVASPTRRLLGLLAVQIFAYHLWRERNARWPGKGVFGPRKLLHGIITDLRARVSTKPWFTTAMILSP